MFDVLLISPPYRGLLREPLGLYYLAGILNSNGISASIIDFNVELPSRREFHDYIRQSKPKIVGITSYTFNFSSTKEIIKETKKLDPKTITILGGVHASALPETILREVPSLDYIVIGEGEFTFLEFCRKALNGENLENIKGIAFKIENEVQVNPPRKLIENLDELPLPNRELLPFKKYPLALVQTTRGCPYNCIFYHINRFYKGKTRQRDAIKVVNESPRFIWANSCNRTLNFRFSVHDATETGNKIVGFKKPHVNGTITFGRCNIRIFFVIPIFLL